MFARMHGHKIIILRLAITFLWNPSHLCFKFHFPFAFPLSLLQRNCSISHFYFFACSLSVLRHNSLTLPFLSQSRALKLSQPQGGRMWTLSPRGRRELTCKVMVVRPWQQFQPMPHVSWDASATMTAAMTKVCGAEEAKDPMTIFDKVVRYVRLTKLSHQD